MRIIAGYLKGREFKAPAGHRTHPMSESMRGALFNMLGDVSGLTLLDAFAGTGAIGFEAVSRGADFVRFIDIDKKAHAQILRNISTLKMEDKAKATNANAVFWSKRNPDELFDLVIIDPPYDKPDLSTVSQLARHVKPNGLMVLSHPGRESAPTVNGVVVVDNRSYGDAALAFYRLDT